MVLCTSCDPLKDRGCNVFLYKNTRRHYKSPNNNLRTFVNFLDQWIYALYRPAPQKNAPLARPWSTPHIEVGISLQHYPHINICKKLPFLGQIWISLDLLIFSRPLAALSCLTELSQIAIRVCSRLYNWSIGYSSKATFSVLKQLDRVAMSFC